MTSVDLPRRFRSRPMRAARFLAQRGLLKPVVWSLTRVTVNGRENMPPQDSAYIAVANHSSHLDAPLVVSALPWRSAKHLAVGAAADYFFDVKWRTWLTVLFFNAYPVDRGGAIQRPRFSKALTGAGTPLLLFPEGGRAQNGEGLRAFTPGAAALAISQRLPVVPIGLVGAQRAMPRGRSWPVRGREAVSVNIGIPLHPIEGESTAAFSARIEQAVSALCEERPRTQIAPEARDASASHNRTSMEAGHE